MRKLYTILGLFIWMGCLQAQYTLERSHVSATDGYQSNSSYSATSTSHAYQAQTYQSTSFSGNSGFLHPNLHTLPPVIQSITDVPNDQGKQVQIIWNKSDYDDEYSTDKFYSVWRQDETKGITGEGLSNPNDVIQAQSASLKEYFWLSDGEVWTYIDTIPALNYSQYSSVAPTLSDSVAGTAGFSNFKIVFHDLFAFYESQPDSGYSVDNLAPEAPVLAGMLDNGIVELSWNASIAPDFQYFAVYRSSEAGPFSGETIAFTVNPAFSDNEPLGDTVCYAVTAFDFNGNESFLSNIAMVPLHNEINLSLKIMLEGPYQSGSMQSDINAILPLSQPYNVSPWNYAGTESVAFMLNSQIVDWVLVELRDAMDAASAYESSIIEQKAAFILEDGGIVDLDGMSTLSFEVPIANNLFAVVYHRNHLPVMSANPIQETGGIYTYNFTSSASQAYGSNQKDLGFGDFGLIGGDMNADGVINLSDYSEKWIQEIGLKGYFGGDANMDSQVNNQDKNDIWKNNFEKSQNLPE
ncbi:MAG: hypothetical protein R2764_10835 [Bacteroidales bacterium]